MRQLHRCIALFNRALVDVLESRLLLSASGSLSLVADFNGANGAGPTSVVEDASGNLFGVSNIITPDNGTTIESGGVFEVPAGGTTAQTIVQFNSPGGTVIGDSLIIDQAGNLFGTFSQYDLDGAPGEIFEIPAGTHSLTTLATIPTFGSTISLQGGSGTLSAVDSSGDLFGYTALDTPFELDHGSSTVTEIGTSNDGYVHDLQLAPNGNLYGVSWGPAQDEFGTFTSSIFEVAAGTSTEQTLATFSSATTGSQAIGLTFDDNSNIFGFCESGGATGDGTVWELPTGSTTISVIASFSASTGYTPISRPVFGASGNLYGLTDNGGGNGDGTLFDVPAGSATPGSNALDDQADLTSQQPAGVDNAGVVDNWQGKAFDAIGGQIMKNNPKIFGKSFGPTTQTTQTGSRGAIYQYNSGNSGGGGGGGGGGNSTTPTSSNVATQQQSLSQQQSTQSSLLGQLKTLKSDPTLAKSLRGQTNTASKLIKQASADLKKANTLESQYTAEGNTIAALQAQLSSATGKSATALQKKIAADQAKQTKLGNLLTDDYNAAVADGARISTLQSAVSTSLATQSTSSLVFSQFAPATPK